MRLTNISKNNYGNMLTVTTLTFIYSGAEERVVVASITKLAAVVCIHLRYALDQIKAVT